MNKGAPKQAESLTAVLSVSSTRTDKWRHLNAIARTWANLSDKATQGPTLRADAAKLLDTIMQVEHCWAYPGQRLLGAITDALEANDASTFARLIQKVSGALLSGDFRRDDFVWDPSAEGEGRLPDVLPPDVMVGAVGKP